MITLAKAKKQKSASAKKNNESVQEESLHQLPQNILQVGERVEENKNIYILQSVYQEIHRFTADKKTNEAGGMLVGTVIEEFGKMNILINGFIEAKYCEATPTTLKFTHQTWDRCHKELKKRFPNQKILGWIHTHPNFGIFLSEYDMFIQNNFFSEPYEVAYVVDPIQSIEGFYFWINGKIERCKGFYIYDKTGKKISPVQQNEKETSKKSTEQNTSVSSKLQILIGILCAAVVVLFVCFVMLNIKINALNQKYDALNQNYTNLALVYRQVISQMYANNDQNTVVNEPDAQLQTPDIQLPQAWGQQTPPQSQEESVPQTVTQTESEGVENG